MRKTKIVCTIGPATESDKAIAQLIDAGMNVARLNFSHGTHALHAKNIERIRRIAAEKEEPIAILQDLAGPKIRTGEIAKGPFQLESGGQFTLTAEPDIDEPTRVSMSYGKLPEEVEVGDQILLADGSIELRVTKVEGSDIICEIVAGGELSSHKGINLPGRSLAVSALTEKDKRDLAFGLENSVDYVAMSFVRRCEDVVLLKEIMQDGGENVPIIAKIEKHEAIDNFDAILEIVDGIMVARGDLAVETPLESVPLVQKMIIAKSNRAGKPVITATQMLKSMVDNTRPTRAEATDVANAVLDGTDAVMLSEETTIGHFPIESVETMDRIIRVTEAGRLSLWREEEQSSEESTSVGKAVSHAAFHMAKDLKAAAILTPTQSGITPRMVSSHRPTQPIIAFSPLEATVRRLNLVWGVRPLLAGGYYNSEEMIEQAKDLALRLGLIAFGDTVVITAGVPIGVAGTTNLIKAEVV